MNILVTGGSGFIGANLIRLLLKHGHQVRVLDNFSAGTRHYLDNLAVELLNGDILDRNVVQNAVNGIDGIVHLAAQTGVPGSIEDPYYDCKMNVIGTLNLLEASRHAHVKRFVFASSNAPIGRQPPPATEDKAPLPISPYGASKLAGEGYCLAYQGSWGLGTIVLRFANVYGPYSKHKNSVVAKFIKDIAKNGKVVIDGDGHQTRDFIYVEDLCEVIVKALESEICGEIFQVATSEETSILGLSQMIQTISQSNFEIAHDPPRIGDIKRNYSQITKANELLDWYPKTNLSMGLKSTFDWFQSNST